MTNPRKTRWVCPYCGLEDTSSWHIAVHVSLFHQVPRGYYNGRKKRWVYPKGYWRWFGMRTYWRHLMALMDPTWTTGRRFKRS